MNTKTRKQMKQLTGKVENYISKLLKNMSLLVASACAIACFILLGTVLLLSRENIKIKKDMADMKKSYEEQVNSLEAELDNQKTEYENLAEISVELDNQNKELVNEINEQNKKLDEYEAREELFDQYEYAIIREDGTRTDITYEEIDTLESLAKERNMGDDAVDLVMAIAMAESDGIEDAKNPKSTATGFGGLLASTAKYIYETELNSPDGTYNHSVMAKDGELNLQMSLCLVDVLADINNRNPYETVKDYRGINDKPYFKKIDKYLATVDKTLHKLII